MGNKTFVDTSGFYALFAKNDIMHSKAADVFNRARKQKTGFITTDYILDETATLLRTRSLGHLVPKFFEIVMATAVCRIEWMDQDRFATTTAFFNKHDDKEWSFTDCFSFVLMKQLRLTDSMTKDLHFKAAGFVPLLI